MIIRVLKVDKHWKDGFEFLGVRICFYTDGLVGGLALSKVSLSGREKKSSSVYIPLEGGNASAHLTRLPPAKIHTEGRAKRVSSRDFFVCVKGDLQSKNNQGAGYQSNLFFVSFERESSETTRSAASWKTSPCESLYSV